MIEKIKIKGFRSIIYQKFENINRSMLFIGENNSGKSAVLNALRVALMPNYEISINDINHASSSAEISIVFNVSDMFYKRTESYFRESQNSFYTRFIDSYTINNKNRVKYNDTYYTEFKKFLNENFFKTKYVRKFGFSVEFSRENLKKKIRLIDSNLSFITLIQFDYSHPIIRAITPEIASIDDVRMFAEEELGNKNSVSNSIFRLFLESISSSEESGMVDFENAPVKNLSVQQLNMILSEKVNNESKKFLMKINNVFKTYHGENILVNWQIDTDLAKNISFRSHFMNKDNQIVDFMSTGSGTRSLYLISLFESLMETLELSNDGGLFLIEEPELYLYPKLEAQMGAILSKLSIKHQLFITSHSGGLVQYFPSDNIYFTRLESTRNAFASRFNVLESVNHLIESLGFNSYPFINKEHVILIEGSEDEKIYKHVIQILFNQSQDNCAFICLGGACNVSLAINIQLIKDSSVFNKCLIILDSDSRSSSGAIEYYIKSMSNSLKPDYRLRNQLKEKFYITENSTMVETLTFDKKYFDKKYSEDKLFNFVDKYKPNIINELKIKVNKNILSKDEIDMIIGKMESKNETEIIYILKRYLINKKLLKSFRNEVCNFMTIDEIDERTELLELVPELAKKLEELFKKTI